MVDGLKSIFSNKLILWTLGVVTIVNISVLLDIPLVRQYSSFFFLTFVPGFLILIVLKLDKIGWAEKIVLSMGLSTSFIMLSGLLLNYIVLLVGYAKPLSLFPLLASFSVATIGLAFIAFRANGNITLSLPNPQLDIKEKVLLIVPTLFPLLSVIGIRLMNRTDNNIILMVLLLLIPIYVAFIAIFREKIPERLYLPFIYLISSSILLLLALRSNNVLGSDVHESYFAFQTTLNTMQWGVMTPSLINSLISISILPSVYKVIVGIDSEYLFKLLFPILFSISPLVIYTMAKKYVGSSNAFLSSFLFMSQPFFFWATSVSQTILAILFFSLAIMVHFHNGINDTAKRMLFLVFMFSGILSHYSASYVFFAMVLAAYLGTKALNWAHTNWRKYPKTLQNPIPGVKNASQDTEGRNDSTQDFTLGSVGGILSSQSKMISGTAIILCFVFIFFWYSQITSSPFVIGVSLIFRILSGLQESLIVELKGPEVVAAFGQSALPSIPQQIRFFVSWLAVIFIALGGLSIALRYKNTVSYPGSENTKMTIVKSKLELEYFVLSAACGAILAAAVLLPFISTAYSMERVYFQSLAILGPFFVIGGTIIARWLRMATHLIILPVLLTFFMSVTGTMYQLFGIPASLLLNSSGTEYENLYISEEESSAAVWLGNNGVGWQIYTDYGLGPRILASQGGIPTTRVQGLLITHYRQGEDVVGYIYLFYPQVVKGESAPNRYFPKEIAPAPELLASRSKLFSAGPVEIYR